ncbi:MAG TPA: T9SS type A sorting domain-containing protein [Chitinophagales bacterium]|nr:T9SS type A sorting domain-containing protein [Chitinophagales bacterium]
MKKIILLAVALQMNVVMTYAQGITFSPVYFQFNMETTDYSVEAISFLQNNSNQQRTIRWIRVMLAQTDSMKTQVCDTVNCFSYETSTHDFILPPNKKETVRLSVFPDSIAGIGSYDLFAYDINDSVNAHATFHVDVTVTDVNGISDFGNEAISIYPNPVKDLLHINLNMNKHITSVDIHNLVGQKIKSVHLQAGLKSVSIPVADLKKGIYFLRLFSNGKEVATVTFSKD